MDTNDARIFFGESFDDVAAIVCGTVIDNDCLEVGKGLRQYTVQAIPKELFRVVDRYDDADFWHKNVMPAKADISFSIYLNSERLRPSPTAQWLRHGPGSLGRLHSP